MDEFSLRIRKTLMPKELFDVYRHGIIYPFLTPLCSHCPSLILLS
jgi:hypothetical protein